MEHENFCKLLSAVFNWERLNKEEDSRNDKILWKPTTNFGGSIKRGRFDNSKAGSDNRPPQQKQNRRNFLLLTLQIMSKASLAFPLVCNVESIIMVLVGDPLVHVLILGDLTIK